MVSTLSDTAQYGVCRLSTIRNPVLYPSELRGRWSHDLNSIAIQQKRARTKRARPTHFQLEPTASSLPAPEKISAPLYCWGVGWENGESKHSVSKCRVCQLTGLLRL